MESHPLSPIGQPALSRPSWISTLRQWVFSTPALLLLTAGILWGTWEGDLTHGDTANHFRRASQWLKAGPIEPDFLATSPLYTVYFAGVHALVRDVAGSVFVHRVLIVLAGVSAFYGLGRRVLPRAWAWFVAAWWVVLPINWRAEYEVHYFGFVLLALAGVLAGGRTWWHRGAALAVLALYACFVRNEYLPAVGLFGVYCVYAAWRRAPAERLIPALAGTFGPAVLAVAFTAWALSGGPKQHPWKTFLAGFEHRQRINLLQVYALGYIQRHDDWQGDPWAASSLLQRDFGQPAPTFSEAWRANPNALREHILWNLRLLPAGLQLGLLARFGDSPVPDFAGRGPERGRNPWPLTFVVAAVCATGAWLLWRFWRKHQRFWLHGAPAKTAWILLLCCLPTTAIGIVTQRPRPNYIFPLLLLLMLFTGLSARLIWGALQRHFRIRPKALRIPGPAFAVLLIVALAGRNRPAFAVHEVLGDVRRLQPFQTLLQRKNGRLATNASHTMELRCYTGMDLVNKHTVLDLQPVLQSAPPERPFAETLAATEVTELFLKTPTTLRAHVQDWRDGASQTGWVKCAEAHFGKEDWEFWSRPAEKPKTQHE